MTTEIKSVEINCATGEVIETPYSAEELAELTTLRAQWEAEVEARIAAEASAAEALEALKVSARAKLVAGEPLTEEEAAVLVI